MKKFAIFGLGNPGGKYQKTRHNIGFLVLDRFSQNTEWKQKSNFGASICEVLRGDEKVQLIKPEKYMNNSGQVVEGFINYFNIGAEDILVIHDDIDLPFGEIRFSKNAGPAGHNGVKSIINHLGTKDFSRLRVGIANSGYNEHSIPSEQFVLQEFNTQEMKSLEDLLSKISEALSFYLENGFEKTKGEYNKSAMPLIET